MAGRKGTIRYSRDGKTRYCQIDGRDVTSEEFDAAFPAKSEPGGIVASPTCWPMTSNALAVHPSQVEEANARNARHGITAHYTPDGTCVLPDRGERRKLLKLEGFHDNEGGYGDG